MDFNTASGQNKFMFVPFNYYCTHQKKYNRQSAGKEVIILNEDMKCPLVI